ncbi:MAG: murein biosynthesis integral membrane protein MurJ, partial [Micrococcales bacterium]|nr:murein biosynthesis integral membrane protein MurJ [Micrococcales bacterium]
MLIAIVLGNGTKRVEVLNFAQMVPNSFYLLLAGGTLNSVLVPQIVRAVQHDEDGGQAFVDRIMTAFLVGIAAATVLLTVGVPLVMNLYVTSEWHSPDMAAQWQSLVLMSYITMPQIFFYSLFFLIGQVLNARDRFGPMMWAPVANNVVAIAMLASYLAVWGMDASNGTVFSTEQVWWLGAGSTLGIAIQTIVLVPYMRKAGFHYRPRFDLRGTGLGRTFNVAKWMVGVVALTFVTQIVVSRLASMAAAGAGGDSAGGLNAYRQAQLISILPHSILAVSLATAMLPGASRLAVAGDRDGVASELTRTIRMATTLILPAAIAFLVLSDPFGKLLFGNGAGGGDYHVISWALAAFAIGLVPYSVQYILLRGFYALSDTRTTFFLQILISVANAGLAIAFVLLLSQPATVAAWLAGGYSASYAIGVFVTFAVLRKRLPALRGGVLAKHLVRITLATVPAVALAWVIIRFVGGLGGTAVLAGSVVAAAVVAIAVYFFVAKRLRVPEVTQVLDMVRRRQGTPGTDETSEIIGTDAMAAVESEMESPVQSAETEPVNIETAESSGGADADEADQRPETDEDNLDPDGVGVFIPVTQPTDPLTYPEPTEPIVRVAADPDVDQVLGGRYRLDEQLAQRGTTQTWRAFDEVLERPVLVHLLAADDPEAGEIVDLARRAAAATDARVLRVLDVVPADPGLHGAYLIYEYAAGQTLANILAGGPLTGAEASWVVREIADTLVGLHAQGLFHGHLNPATVLITSSGNIKITGLLVNVAFDGVPLSERDEACDVDALGALLYACLTGHWPDKAPADGNDARTAFGLPLAPVRDGAFVPPHAVLPGVAPAVEAVADRIMSPIPRRNATKLVTAQDVTTALSLVLGSASAAQDLRTRLHMPVEDGPVSFIAPPAPALPPTTLSVSGRVPAEPVPLTAEAARPSSPDE